VIDDDTISSVVGNLPGALFTSAFKAKNNNFISTVSQMVSELSLDALINAKKRGVEVKVVLDKVQNKFQKYSAYKYLKSNKIDIKLDKNRFKLHNKVLIIDNNILITGSYNYTKKANRYNDENILIIKDKNITQQYISDFNRINS